MMKIKQFICATAIIVAAVFWSTGQAQTAVSEDFTGKITSNLWYSFNGACLTAGTSSGGSTTTTAGTIPGCTAIKSLSTDLTSSITSVSYGGESLVGGQNGVSGSTQTLPDPSGSGALRFTNGYPGGYSQHGAIVSGSSFPTGQGIQVTFKTVTYRGDSGGTGGDGADGISFYLIDAKKGPGIGAWGGSLAYSCSNSNTPYDGLAGGYIGLGIDEYGNFLNGSSLMTGYTGTNSATGDNTALGYGYKPGRIGIRGAGSVSWASLSSTTAGYGNNPYSSSSPYYPASLSTTCSSGTYNPSATSYGNACPVCSSGTVSVSGSTAGSCINVCASGSTFDGTNCVSSTPVCPSGYKLVTSGTYAGQCYNKNSTTTPYVSPTYATSAPTSASPGSYGTLYSLLAVKNTCSTGTLYNYSTPSAPTSAGATSLSNSKNTASILDYAPIPNAYKELSGVQIANESAMSRPAATPIFYNLKITQDGLLSLSYSISGGAYQPVIKNQSITASNGPLPSNFLFAFAGSSGGSTNIHEIMCFKAATADQSGSSATVNEKQAAKVEAGTQAYFAFYNPSNWTGKLTANNLIDTAGVVTVSSTANWDASCALTGVASGGTCDTTKVSGPTAAESPTSRVMMTWNGTKGIPFEWTNLTTAQQNALDAGDSSTTSNRLSYLRGDRTNEINTSGIGLYRAREGVLGDIVDSSPAWVGPPSSPYTATWRDRLYSGASALENSGGQTYLQFVTSRQTRQNVVYGGANDGFLHGFRAGSFDANGNFVNNSTTPNDGLEVLAYMPGGVLQSAASSSTSTNCTNSAATQSVVQNIHGLTPAIGSSTQCVDPSLDYSNTQYGHNFFVDASPGTGDLFYGAAWHTWLVGGLGPGGAAIYALDITDPSKFTESNAANTAAGVGVVIGEWNSATITCSNVSNCGQNLGNTYGTPQIRRLHNGQWAVIFGNGFGSSSGDAGIYVMTVDQTTGGQTFYYLSTGKPGSNGIAYVTPVDLDGDHITDYVYAGDLQGNVWRFDLTNNTDPTKWAAASAPLFTTQSGQPITSQLLSVITTATGSLPRLMIEFGTGKRTQLTNTTAVAYTSGTQDLYGVWDWNLSAWNTLSPGAQFASLSASTAATGLSSPYTLAQSNLQKQTFTIDAATGNRDGTNNTVCWQGMTLCVSPALNNAFGWYVDLPGGSEQIIFNPIFQSGAFIVDSTVPANNIPTSCTINLDTGFTYAISVSTGGVFTSTFPKYKDTQVAGTETDATGSPYVVTTAEGTTNLVYQTVSGTPGAEQVNIPSNTKTKRLTWIEKR